jgi:hypothetical protein
MVFLAGPLLATPFGFETRGNDMSKRAYDKFQRAMDNDPQLAQKLRERIAEGDPTQRVDITVEFARRHGFEIDAMDVRRALS